MKKIVYIIAIVIVFGSAASLFFYFQNKKQPIDNGYSAVFLDNNQVYFAKIKDRGKKYVTIIDVYYFGKDPSAGSGRADDIVLVKLGSEVHGPIDGMEILENHILYIEKLADSSRVVQAIREYETKGN